MSSEVEIKKLNIRQSINIYNKNLKKDFPDNERRPLLMIINGMLKGTYECLGAFSEGKMLGYAFFVKLENDYLWDYFAVFENQRCKGVGSRIIKAVMEYYKTANSVIGEVEDPEYAGPNEDGDMMERRYKFYLRNGCIDTGVKAITFGVHFIIIQISGSKLNAPEVAKLYCRHYKKSLPKHLYDGNVEVY